MKDKSIESLSSDKPLIDPADDKLGYAPFAKHLSDAICNMMPPDGLVMAIYAPWGMGKSTVLEFVVYYLKQRDEEQPIIVRFNPWWFSGQENLTRYFFVQMQLAVSTKLREVAKRIGEFFSTASKLTSKIPGLEATGFINEILEKGEDITQLKAKIADALQKQNTKILIIIDDIDRLTAEEIRQLFGLIKSVADFPNVIYLLAFDKQVVTDALSASQGISGEAYLEKIVQIPFELPLPDDLARGQLLLSALNRVLGDVPTNLFDQKRWQGIYRYGIGNLFHTPRDVTRFVNTLRVTYSAVKSEVNVVDFLAIESLRVFHPYIYDLIRKNPEQFLNSGTAQYNPAYTNNLKRFHDAWIQKLPESDRESVETIISMIFPNLRSVFSISTGIFSIPTTYDTTQPATWRKQRRICVSEVFPVYFRLQVSEGNISNSEMQRILANANQLENFERSLREMISNVDQNGTSRIDRFLEKLRDYVDGLTSNDTETVITSLFDLNDEIIGVKRTPGFFMLPTDWVIWGDIQLLLENYDDESKRFEILKTCFEHGKSVSRIVDSTLALGHEYGKYEGKPEPDQEKTVSEDHLKILEQIALSRIRQASQEKDGFLKLPNLRQILRLWFDLADDEVKNWVSTTISEDDCLIELLEAFLSELYSQSATGTTTFYRLDPEWFKLYLEPAAIIDRVKTLKDRRDLTPNQKRALKQFIHEYEIRQQGKNPENEFMWNKNPAGDEA